MKKFIFVLLIILSSSCGKKNSNEDTSGVLYSDLIGNVTGDVTGNLTGNVSGNVNGNVIGNLTGDVIGNLTGNVTGDVMGTANKANSLSNTRIIWGQAFNGTKDIEGDIRVENILTCSDDSIKEWYIGTEDNPFTNIWTLNLVTKNITINELITSSTVSASTIVAGDYAKAPTIFSENIYNNKASINKIIRNFCI
jgi:hypothetical protein